MRLSAKWNSEWESGDFSSVLSFITLFTAQIVGILVSIVSEWLTE